LPPSRLVGPLAILSARGISGVGSPRALLKVATSWNLGTSEVLLVSSFVWSLVRSVSSVGSTSHAIMMLSESGVDSALVSSWLKVVVVGFRCRLVNARSMWEFGFSKDVVSKQKLVSNASGCISMHLVVVSSGLFCSDTVVSMGDAFSLFGVVIVGLVDVDSLAPVPFCSLAVLATFAIARVEAREFPAPRYLAGLDDVWIPIAASARDPWWDLLDKFIPDCRCLLPRRLSSK